MDHARRPLLDGALPLTALVGGSMLIGLQPLTYLLASLYLAFATGMASEACHRDTEPAIPWRLYALATAALSVLVPVLGLQPGLRPLLAVPLTLIAAGFYLHVRLKGRYGTGRIGLLSACGRRKHDALVGRMIEAMCVVLALGTLLHGAGSAAGFAVAGWLLTAAAVAERAEPGATMNAPEARPPVAERARAA